MIRNLLIIFLVATTIYSCGNNEGAAANSSVTEKQFTSIQWIDSVKNYGNINEGQKLAISFRFKNSGEKPLIIESVKPSCGCTIADYPKEPIAPGAEGEITGEFDSHSREGLQHKELTVMANTSPVEHNILFEVNVIKSPGATAPPPFSKGEEKLSN
ncbi:MAG: DUF1573 domain-containing protein [Chitinophagaceae bacterium]|nr:DUF1573 domain-containing protein [Chitinophagaceae bacterium]